MVTTTKISGKPTIIADDILLFDANSGVGSYANTISGSFTYPAGDKPCSILVNKGVAICGSACHAWLGFPETVLYRYKDGKFGIGKFKYDIEIPNRTDVLWAIGGMGLGDKYNPAEEGFSRFTKNGKTYNYSDVLRATSHTMLGIKDGKCYLVYVPYASGAGVNNYAKSCGFEYAVMGDGGHISAINGSEYYAKKNLNTKQGYAIQGINSNFTTETTKKKVIIDSGHSVVTSGKRSFDNTLLEHEFNYDVSTRIKKILLRHDIDTMVLQVVRSNSASDVNERIRIIDSIMPDAVVSIHANAYGTYWNNANGWEIYCYEPNSRGKSYQLAKAIHDNSIPFLGLTDRGIKDARGVSGIVMLSHPPAVLIEHGFYTNRVEVEKLKDSAFRQQCAEADSKGILSYLNVQYIAETIEETPQAFPKLYRVYEVHEQTRKGVFAVKENADNVLAGIISAGKNGYIKEDK